VERREYRETAVLLQRAMRAALQSPIRADTITKESAAAH